MKKSICCKSKTYRMMIMMLLSLAFLLLIGCGNGNARDKDSSQENQAGNQTSGEQNQPAGQDQTSGGQSQPSEQRDQANAGQDQTSGEQAQPAENQTEGVRNQPENQQEQPGQQTQTGSQGNSVNQPKIGMEEAKEAALKHAGLTASEATFVKEEMDYENGRTEYELEFVSGDVRYKYEISGDDGAVLESSQETVEQIPGNIQGVISVEEAKTAVLSHAGFTADQVAFTKIELEQEHGGAEYEIDFYADGKEYSSKVDAVTGAILEYELD